MEGDIKLWVHENWRRWEQEEPKWFDENLRARIPVEWIPVAKDRVRESERRRSIRKRSIIYAIAGNVMRFQQEESLPPSSPLNPGRFRARKMHTRREGRS